jgi:hypothetical protein
MATKTFKIGEYAIGGIIQVRTTSDTINIDSLDWTTKEKIMGREFRINMYDVEYEIFKYLNELTSSYYADKVTDFIKENVKFIY